MVLYNDFPDFIPAQWGASDTETFTYIDNRKVTNDELKDLGKRKPQKFFREHASVRVWAWQFSDGKYFFVSNDFDEYLHFLADHSVKNVWFYNAKFDFAQIDYQLLTHDPVFVSDTKAHSAYTYESLHSDKGGRFTLTIRYPHRKSGKGSRKVDRHERTHTIRLYDFCNIFGGGLKSLLDEFKVVDFDGNPIRKSTMDYQGVDEYAMTAEELQYLKNDTIGLYHLIRIANIELQNLTGYNLTGKKPDVITAGGLAKKMLLKYLYRDGSDRQKIHAFQFFHPVTLRQDLYCRKFKLYCGGICTLNSRYANMILPKPLFRYDVNSEYPFVMSQMRDLQGHGKQIKMSEWKSKSMKYKSTHAAIYVIDYFSATLRENMIPIFRNPYTSEFEENPYITERFLIFESEFNELENWYDISFICDTVVVYEAVKIDGYRNFVESFYRLKTESKKKGDKAKTAFAKLMLNSSYGKLAEKTVREITKRELNPDTGAVHLIRTLETETNDANMLSVVQGAFVTASARVYLMSHIREICGNVAENFVYCDTDSIHTFVEYRDSNAFVLGGFKDESPDGGFNFCKYIAPKAYFDGVKKAGKVVDLEIHCKGVNVQVVNDELKRDGKFRSPEFIEKRFAIGQRFQPLAGMNIRGGKALIPLVKFIAKPLKNFESENGLYIEL